MEPYSYIFILKDIVILVLNILFPFIAGILTALCVYFLKNHVCNCSGVVGFIGFVFLTITLYGGILFLTENKIMLANIKLIKEKII